ncbi:MAG: hypothetical protein ACI9BH_003370 [Paracoccaceae bacterium]|jgi:hypothetical protein
MRIVLFNLLLLLPLGPVLAQNESLGLAAPQAVLDSGLLQHILPRFSLKTGIRVLQDDAGIMVLTNARPGTPVLRGGGVIYYLRIGTNKRQKRFHDWLLSEIGQRTINSYQPDGTQPFTAVNDIKYVEEAVDFDGNKNYGARLSLTHCGRCHVVSDANRMNGLGSTPSFAVLRSFADWNSRFVQFYLLRPHGSFTQITDVTEPFDKEFPPSIVPVEISLNDLDDILAYVATMKPADLGADLHLQ